MSFLFYLTWYCLHIVVSNAYCAVFFILFVFVLCLVYPMLPVSLDCPLLIAASVFSNIFPFHFSDLELMSFHEL